MIPAIRPTMLVALVAACALALPITSQAAGDGPEISRSRGKVGGSIVLWPRVVPETNDPTILDIATKLQAKLGQMSVQQISESKTVVRPPPERVCPQEGCKSVSLGVMLGHQDGGCAAVAMVGAPGTEGSTLVAWGGKFDFKSQVLNFREPPETVATVTEFVPCGELLTTIDDAALQNAIANVR